MRTRYDYAGAIIMVKVEIGLFTFFDAIVRVPDFTANTHSLKYIPLISNVVLY